MAQRELEEQNRRPNAQTGNGRHRKEEPRGRTDSNLCRCGRTQRADTFQPCCSGAGGAGDFVRASRGAAPGRGSDTALQTQPRLRSLPTYQGQLLWPGAKEFPQHCSPASTRTSAPGGAAQPGTATGAFYAWLRAEVAAAASLQSRAQTGRTRVSSQRLALSPGGREVAVAKRRLKHRGDSTSPCDKCWYFGLPGSAFRFAATLFCA